MVTQKDGGHVSRAVREALGTLVSPQVYAQLIQRSLHTSGLSEIPERGRVLVQWVRGPLSREIEVAVGADAAELVIGQLAPIMAHAAPPTPMPSAPSAARVDPFGSDVPTGLATAPKSRGQRPDLARTVRMKLSREQMSKLQESGAGATQRPHSVELPLATGSEGLTRVLTASTAPHAIEALRTYLDGTASVVPISDLVSLLDVVEAGGLLDPIVLLDCQRPSLHVTSVAAIGEDLPRGTTIVLWGADDATWNQLDRERVPSCKWVRCSQEATTDDVGSLCAMLIRSVRR